MNRAERRKRDQEIKRALRAGVGVAVRLDGYRIVRADGSIKHAVGRQPGTQETQR